MKFLNAMISILFKERFGFFDVVVMFILFGLSETYKNPWLWLLLLPVSIFSGAMGIRVRNQEK